MKRILVSALALALLPGLAFAQANITRSLQGSQDPRGPVGIDPSNSVYFPNHLNAFGNTSKTVTASCGVGSAVTAGSTDTAGSVLTGGGASNVCNIIFGSTYNSPPNCVANGATYAASQNTFATTITSFTIVGVASAATVNWICIGNQ